MDHVKIGKKSKRKGSTGERELIKRLQEELGHIFPKIRRNYDQAYVGGHDIFGVPPWAIECKRQRKYDPKWMEQAIEQAKDWQTPVVIYRLDRQRDWTCEMLAGDLLDCFKDTETGKCYKVSMPLKLWVAIVRERI